MNATVDRTAPSPQWKSWIPALVLTLLLHVAVLLARFEWTMPQVRPPTVAVQPISPERLEAVRKQWAQKDKSLLLNKNPNAPSAKEAAPDAKYSSDRNIRVEKEQRAKRTDVLPKAATGLPNPPAPLPAQPRSETPPVRDLSKMGVPFRLTPSRPQASQPQAAPHGELGADQAIRDEALPEGAENLLNTQESVHYSFYSRIYQAIAPIWQAHAREAAYQRKPRPGEYNTVADVVLGADGEFLGARILRSSGIPEFDRIIDLSWRKAKRFPNPPKALLDERREVHMVWTYSFKIGDGMAFYVK